MEVSHFHNLVPQTYREYGDSNGIPYPSSGKFPYHYYAMAELAQEIIL